MSSKSEVKEEKVESKSEGKVEAKIETKISELLQRICTNKVARNDPVYRWNLTPDEGWCDTVEEARERGISIKAFGDTHDKIVLHPGHLGYKFNYFWGQGTWSKRRCWDKDVKSDDREKANNELWVLARELTELKYVVWIVLPSGNEKGYLSTYIFEPNEWQEYTGMDDIL